MMMALVEVLAVIAVVAIIAYLTYAIVGATSQPQQKAANADAHWVTAHYAVSGATRVVVQRVGRATGDVLDEHVVVEIPNGDPDFDQKFLEAMAQARGRAALFESESD
jgi:hypothetical protein